LDDYLKVVQYVVDLVGIDHVGVGTDMSVGTYPDGDLIRGMPGKGLVGGEYAEHVEVAPRSRLRYVDGFDDYGDLPQVADALGARGFDDASIGKLLGGNWLRAFEAAWS
jgi:membrane dipeptidase